MFSPREAMTDRIHKIRQLFLVAGALALVACLWSPTARAVDFSKSEKAQLKAGKTVIQLLPSSGKKGFYGGSGYALIDAPIDEVWKTILKWEDYPKMFPHTDYCEPLSRKDDRTLIKMKIGHPVVSVHFHVETVADHEKKSLEFDLVSKYPHDIDSIHGYWRLFPQSGNRTLAAYVVSVQAPMGIVTIAGEQLAQDAIMALLSIPGDVRTWMKKNRRNR